MYPIRGSCKEHFQVWTKSPYGDRRCIIKTKFQKSSPTINLRLQELRRDINLDKVFWATSKTCNSIVNISPALDVRAIDHHACPFCSHFHNSLLLIIIVRVYYSNSIGGNGSGVSIINLACIDRWSRITYCVPLQQIRYKQP